MKNIFGKIKGAYFVKTVMKFWLPTRTETYDETYKNDRLKLSVEKAPKYTNGTNRQSQL